MSEHDPFARRTPFDLVIIWGGRSYRVRYRSDVDDNPAYAATIGALREADRTGRGDPQRLLARVVSQMIEAWDATDQHGRRIPITDDALYAMPFDLLMAVLNTLAERGHQIADAIRMQDAPEHQVPPPMEPGRN